MESAWIGSFDSRRHVIVGMGEPKKEQKLFSGSKTTRKKVNEHQTNAFAWYFLTCRRTSQRDIASFRYNHVRACRIIQNIGWYWNQMKFSLNKQAKPREHPFNDFESEQLVISCTFFLSLIFC